MSVKKHKETIKQRFIIYLLTYHIIFVTKFRKKVIINEMRVSDSSPTDYVGRSFLADIS